MKPSGDYFNFVTDKTISKIEGLQKSVDDVLAQGRDNPDIEDKLDRFFAKCKEYNVILSPKKFQASTLIKYGGFIIQSEGQKVEILPDTEQLVKIRDFPVPKAKKKVQEFCGIVCVLDRWTNKTAAHATVLNKLMCKNTAFLWTDECQEQFDKVKFEMDHLLGLIPYDLEKPIEIYTDASKEGGLGYVMAQPQNDGTRAVIQWDPLV